MTRIGLFISPGQPRPFLGSVEGGAVIDLGTEAPGADLTLLLAPSVDWPALIARAPKRGPRTPAAVRFLPPVPQPGKIICMGLNYADHAAEWGHAKPDYPSFLMRVATSLVGHVRGLVRPRVSDRLDYEAELVLVVDQQARHLSTGSRSTASAC
jgi:acylpyruvate hydrolase